MVQSLSPEQTSKWCESLAPCGLRGELLTAMQGAIRQQQIDGKQFDGLLKANSLQSLGVEGINPRMSVAIRRAWNTDFANVKFIPHYAGQPAGMSARPADAAREPPPFEHRTRSAEVRATTNRLGSPAQRLGSPAQGRTGQALNFYDNGFGDVVQPKAPAPTSYAPPQPNIRPPVQPSRQVDKGAEGLENFYNKGFAELLQAKAPAPNSYAPPQPLARPPRQRTPGDSQAGGGLGDIFAPRPKAPTSFANPVQGHHGQQRCSRSDVGGGVLEDDACASRQHARAGAQTPDRRSPSHHQIAQHQQSVGERQVDRRSESGGQACYDVTLLRPQSCSRAPSRERGCGWEGSSLGEVLDSKPVALAQGHMHSQMPPDATQGQEPRHSRKQQPSAEEWGGASLGDVFGAKPPARNRYGAPDEQTTQNVPRKGRACAAQDEAWAGTSLGDALAPKPPARNRYAPAEESSVGGAPPQGRHAAVGTGWEGVSLGDALGSGNAARNESAKCSAQSQQPSMQGGNFDPKPKADAVDPWAGVSLGDALGGQPKPAPAPVVAEPRVVKRGGAGRGTAGAKEQVGSCDKSPAEISAWLRTLPESHVPEQTREGIVELVEKHGYDGGSFTEYVATIPPEVCAPKHAMKLKAAWKNVLAEAEARAICKQNLDHAANAPKAVALKL